MVDIEGNVYRTVKIGNQTWMAENLRTTKYNDGQDIPLVAGSYAWGSLTTPGYCWLNNDQTNKNIYGALYNWYAADADKLAPTGWHVPDDEDWAVLVSYLGGESVAGGKLKEVGTIHWGSPNTGATDEAGFTALPSGYRNYDGIGGFTPDGLGAFFWSSTHDSDNHARGVILLNDSSDVDGSRSVWKSYGRSVRLIKDN